MVNDRVDRLVGKATITSGLRLRTSKMSRSLRGASENGAQLDRAQELCESRGNRPGLPVPEIVLVVSMDVKQHCHKRFKWGRAQQLCESRGGRPGLPAPKTVLIVSVDVKQHCTQALRAQ